MDATNDKKRLFQLDRENLALKTENRKLQAKIDYLSMMTDVEFDEEEGAHNEPQI